MFDVQFSRDGQRGWIVGENGRSLMTLDGGVTWTPFLPDSANPYKEDLIALELDLERGRGIVVARDQTIVTSLDGEENYAVGESETTRLETGMELRRAPPNSPGLSEVVYSTEALKNNRGLQWIVWEDENPAVVGTRVISSLPDGLRAGITDGTPDRAWAAGSDGNVVELSDPDHYSDDFGIAAVSSSRTDGNIYSQTNMIQGLSIAVGDGGLVLKSSPQGGWERQSTPTKAGLRSVYFQPGEQIGWASSGWDDGNEEGARPAILQTLDGGKTWEKLAYRHLPAPWVLYLAIPALVFALYQSVMSWLDVRNAPEPIEAIEDAAATDAPIGWADRDVLGLKPIARALSKFLRNPSTEPPLSFAITGQWGTGKSSLMNLLAEDLRHFDSMPVWFNAWHHQKEQHLLAALLENIRAQSIPPWWRYTGLRFRFRLLVQRMGSLLKGTVAIALVTITALLVGDLLLENGELGAALDAVRGLTLKQVPAQTVPDFAKGVFGFGALGAMVWGVAVTLLKLRVITLNPAKLMASLNERASVGALRDQLDFRHRFAKEFGEVCRALRMPGRAGMVIMIDDLDRCRPENVLDVLEAVNFLVTAGRCFVVLGIDQEKVTSSVAYGFRNSILKLPQRGDPVRPNSDPLNLDAHELANFAHNYLEKLINITVPVPEATGSASIKLLGAMQKKSKETSSWPRRTRRWLRNAVDLTFGLVPITVVAVAVVFAVTKGIGQPAAKVAEPSTEQAQADRTGTVDASAGSGSTQPRARAVSGRNQAEQSNTVTSDVLRAGQPWLLYLVFGTTLTMIGLLALARTTVEREADVSDRPEFLRALAICNEAIFAANPTPRGVKRFQNRLRYFAMRTRGDEHAHDWIDRVYAHLGHEVGPTQKSRESIDIPEATLVGLGTIDAYGENGEVSSHFKEIWKNLARRKLNGEVPKALEKPLETLESRFPDKWPPSREQVSAFTALSQSIET